MKYNGFNHNGKCVKCGKKALRQDFRCKKCGDEFIANMPDTVIGVTCNDLNSDDEPPALKGMA